MKLLQLTALAATTMASVAFAQSATPSGTSSAPAATHTIKVGYPIGQHAFQPETTVANLGDKIIFEMYPQNHSVVRMDPGSPCIPYDMAGHPEEESWWSGFYAVKDPKNPKIFDDIVVDTTDPIWFYCSAPDSCMKFGMVGVININNTENDFESVKKKATTDVDFSLTPGEEIPSENGKVPGAASTSAAAANDHDDHGGSGLSGGAIAGIVIGAIGAFALVGLLFFLVGRKKKSVEVKEKAAADAEAAAKAQEQHPPMYQDPTADPRYSMAPGSPPPDRDTFYGGKPGHQSLMADHTGGSGFQERHPHRMSELPSQNYDPVEIYTPGLPEHMDFPKNPAAEGDNRQ